MNDKKIINIPDAKITRTPYVTKEITKTIGSRMNRITKEFQDGFNFIKKYPKSVTFFGSARFKENTTHYKRAKKISGRLSKLGYAIVTGGGPGIMQAANQGATESGGASVGLNISLPMEQVKNPYVNDSIDFSYFFSRKVVLSFSAEAYIYFPGGFGTLDELFEILTLVQTNKIPKTPIILVGSDFWKPLDSFIRTHILKHHKSISPSDVNLYKITDDEDEIIETVTKAPIRKEG